VLFLVFCVDGVNVHFEHCPEHISRGSWTIVVWWPYQL